MKMAIILSIMVPARAAFSQMQYGGTPYAFSNELKLSDLIEHEAVLQLSPEQQALRDYYSDRITPPGEAMHAGFPIETNIRPDSHGLRTTSHGKQIWQMAIRSPEAKAVGLVFKDFFLPEGARLFIYDSGQKHIAGSFTHKNNTDDGTFTTQIIPGDHLIIEYQEKKRDDADPEWSGNIHISDIIHISQGSLDTSGGRSLGNAGECHVNVNCSEGSDWQRQKRGVARMLMRVGNNYYWCSGSLINNTRQDGTPFLITAAHCGSDATFEDYQLWQFYFNFERPVCEDEGLPAHNVLYGAEFMSEGPLEGGSDFKLLRLNQKPPASWRPYYNGWNRVDEAAQEGVAIHHPAGDAKKISTFDQPLTSSSPLVSGQQMAENSAWRVTWKETDNGFGVTQGGSSGSPIFNQDGLIVGTLTGGSSNCNATHNPDFFGKLSYHWDQNGDVFHEQIAGFLDPLYTGATELPGYDPVMPSYPPPGFVKADPTPDQHVEVKWHKPGQTPNKAGWHTYATSYSGKEWYGPERATLFHADAFNFSYPATISKVSHVFFESASNPWASDEFRFVFYDHTATNILHSSDILHAEHLTEIVYELEEPIVVNNAFYVAVDPIHPTGRPSSAFERMNLGNAVSFYGNRFEWHEASDANNQYVYLTKVYIDDETNTDNINNDKGVPSGRQAAEQIIASAPGDKPVQPEGHRWENSVIQYYIYKNGDLIHVLDSPDQSVSTYSHTDESGHSGENFDAYYVTALYPDGVESQPSNTAWLSHLEFCDVITDVFPFGEDFETGEIPECWTADSPGTGWEITTETTFNEVQVEPFTGTFFAFVEHHESDEAKAHWLITPPLDISGLETPALGFWFNASYPSSSSGPTLSAYVKPDDGSFNKLWDAHQHPGFTPTNELAWYRARTDLSTFTSAEKIRIAFQIDVTEASFSAIDGITIKDAANEVYPLSLEIMPSNRGEVYGAGNFIGGERVTVHAEPNIDYHFHYWLHEEDTLTTAQTYHFLMPDSPYTLTALFDQDSPPVSATDFDMPESGISIYPNPSTGRATIHFPDNHDNVTLRVFDSQGRMIREQTHDRITGNTELSLNLQGYPNGLYFVSIQGSNMSRTLHLQLTR